MTQLNIENLRIDPTVGDGIAFTVDISGTARRFFVHRETLGDLERTLLTDSHDMLASFDRQIDKVRQAVSKTLKLGSSGSVTFLTPFFFD